MVVILVLVIRDVHTSKITACGVAPCAFRRGEPSRASPILPLSISEGIPAWNNESCRNCFALRRVSFPLPVFP